MAVINEYVNSNLAADKLDTPAIVKTGKSFVSVTTFEVASGDDDTSKYRLFKNLDPELIPIRIEVYNDAITSGTDYDLGLYETLSDGQGGVVADVDVFLDGVSMAGARASDSPLNGLTAVDIANRTKRLYELVGDTIITKKQGYDLVLTANTVGSSAGTITVIAEFAQG